MALVPDALINPQDPARAALPDLLDVLERSGYGVLQLPPPGRYGLLLAVIADQVAEYAHHGYAVVAIGMRGEPGDGLHWRSLAPLLRHRGVALPPRHLIRPDLEPRGRSTALRRLPGRLRFAGGGAAPLARVARFSHGLHPVRAHGPQGVAVMPGHDVDGQLRLEGLGAR